MQNQVCSKHGQQGLFVDNDEIDESKKVLCPDCIVQKYENISILSDQQTKIQNIIEKIEMTCNENIEILQSIYMQLERYCNNINNYIEKIKQTINQQQLLIQEEKNKSINLSGKILIIKNQEVDKFNKLFSNLKSIFFHQFQLLKQHIDIDSLQQKALSLQTLDLQDEIYNKSVIQYENIQNNLEQCSSISLNYDSSIIIIAIENYIKFFQIFEDYNVKQIQEEKRHLARIFCLMFFKKSNQFFSASDDMIIKLWKYNDKQWQEVKNLVGHTQQIRCLAIHPNDNYLISGGCDTQLRFWNKLEDWKSQIISQHKSTIVALSINQFGQKLISLEQSEIQIHDKQENQWKQIQNIKLNDQGFQISFLSENKFAFLPKNGNSIHVYDINQQGIYFFKQNIYIPNANDSKFGFTFPIQFIYPKMILIVKHGMFVNIIIEETKDQFITQQSLHFQSDEIFGIISQNCEIIVIFDNQSKSIQIKRAIIK